MNSLFEARSVAVVGASPDPRKRGHQIIRALQAAGYEGTIYPVNPKGGEILGVPVVSLIAELPAAPDLAVICTPAATTPDVVRACGERGVRGAVVLAVGFSESGAEGAALEADLLAASREAGVRLIGPNTSGILNAQRGLNLIGARGVRAGRIALLVQSGNIALALMNEVTDRSWAGISICAGLGNESDVGFGEALEFLGAHEGTDAIACHVEGVRDARRFLAAAAQVTPTTPIVVIKSGRSEAGAAAARSHTGAVAGPYDRLRAAFRQCGVVEVTRTDELLHVTETLASQPAPPEGGVVILSDGGGQGTLAADYLSEAEVALASLSEATRWALRELLGPAAAVNNPVDLAGAADGDPQVFARATELIAADPGAGTILLVGLFGGYGIRFEESLAPGEVAAAEGMVAALERSGKGMVAHTMYATHRVRALEVLGRAGIPVVGSLDVACRAISELWRRGRWLSQADHWKAPGAESISGGQTPPLNSAEVRSRALTEPEARALLEGSGVTFEPAVFVGSEAAAISVAEAMLSDGREAVAMKVVSTAIAHKTEAGGVILGIRSASEAATAWGEIHRTGEGWMAKHSPHGRIDGVLVTPMLSTPRVELLVGAIRDPVLGSMLTLGAGGIWVEQLADVSHRLLPVTPRIVHEMLDELRITARMGAVRGFHAIELTALVATVLAIGRVLKHHPEVLEVEVNPLFVFEDRVVPVDARVYVKD